MKNENSEYWKARLRTVFYEYCDLTVPNYCFIGLVEQERICEGKLEFHHLIGRGAFEFNHDGIIRLCSKHHRESGVLSAHKTPEKLKLFIIKYYEDHYYWMQENKNKIIRKCERQTFKELYNKYTELLKLEKEKRFY